jgi:uncharacterized membrane protein
MGTLMAILGPVMLVIGFVVIMVGKVWNLIAKYSYNDPARDRAAVVTIAGAVIGGGGRAAMCFFR